MADGWESLPVVCEGGLDLSEDALTQGTMLTGSAKILQNYECALEGGYRRIDGYSKWDTNTVPGDASTPILGVKVGLGGVFAARYITGTTDNAIYFSTGSGWGSPINTTPRPGAVVRVRMAYYSITKPVIIFTDGFNTAGKYDGTTWTDINGVGAPVNPKYAELFKSRLVLSGYTAKTAISISAPNDDTDFTGGSGAIEINVGDTVVGLKTFREELYIFCTNSIFKLTGNTSSDFVVVPVTRQIGCVNGDTIQEVGGDLIFLAPDGFRSVRGTMNIGDVDLSLQSKKIQPIIRAVLKDSSVTQFASCPVRKKSQYRCWFYAPSVADANSLGIIGKLESAKSASDSDGGSQTGLTYAWSTMVGMKPYCADSLYDGSVERAVFGHPTTGYVYLMETGGDFDGTPIQAVFQSPFLTFKDATLRKVMQKLNLYTQFEGANTINLQVKFDFENSGILQPPSVPLIQQGTFPQYGVAVYGTDAYGEVQFPVFKQNLIGSGFTVAFLYSSTGGFQYRIDSYQITFALKGRR